MKMIIADDEKVIIEGLKKIIPWQDYGIEIVATAKDGLTALREIELYQPDIALLDIKMPNLSGIDILKEIRSRKLDTKTIFISGFQDFKYAKAAVDYGAKGYLVKPIIRQEMIETIQSCIREIDQSSHLPAPPTVPSEQWDEISNFGETGVTPVLLQIIYGENSKREQKLIQFSVESLVQNKLTEENQGIIVHENNATFLLIKDTGKDKIIEVCRNLIVQIKQEMNQKIAMIAGPEVTSLVEINESYEACLALKKMFFFAEEWDNLIHFVNEDFYSANYSIGELDDYRNEFVERISRLQLRNFTQEFQHLARLIAMASNGNREDANFHFFIGIRAIYRHMRSIGLHHELDMQIILTKAREASSYENLKRIYFDLYQDTIHVIKAHVEKNENQVIQQAKEYIITHYKENLSLELIANHIHMNPYYFSSFFKKHTRTNYKDYVNELRLKEALSLLLGTNLNVNEIAHEVGFSDARSFTKAFQKKYHDTPGNYKKSIKAN